MNAVTASVIGTILTLAAVACAVVAHSRSTEAYRHAKTQNLGTAYNRQVESSSWWAAATTLAILAYAATFIGAWLLW